MAVSYFEKIRTPAIGIDAGGMGHSDRPGRFCRFSVLLGKMVAVPESPDLLFGVNPWNPLTFTAVTLLVVSLFGWQAGRLRGARLASSPRFRCALS
ncbi:MAG TPA: hypothetical protein VEZ90_16245 [Blastocatellia bacterium]|nr:hypothetical protein [Blastocatellia bacterium]